jgi:hypothetical protein
MSALDMISMAFVVLGVPPHRNDDASSMASGSLEITPVSMVCSFRLDEELPDHSALTRIQHMDVMVNNTWL